MKEDEEEEVGRDGEINGPFPLASVLHVSLFFNGRNPTPQELDAEKARVGIMIAANRLLNEGVVISSDRGEREDDFRAFAAQPDCHLSLML